MKARKIKIKARNAKVKFTFGFVKDFKKFLARAFARK